jgi:sterol desaturase/sphingolipid hydroxylase (fatty acid hydroxylase superfamily)
MRGMDRLAQILSPFLAYWQNQLGGTFIAPGSTFSVFALAITLTAAALFTVRNHDVALKTLIRALFPRRLWQTRSGRNDIAWFALSIGGIGFALGGAIVAMPTVSGWTADALTALIGERAAPTLPGWLIIGLTTISLFLAYELAYWFDHWAMHRFRWLWAFHQVHHSAESLSLLTIARVHPVETIGFYNLVALFMGMTSGLMSYLLGPTASPATLFGTNVLTMISAVLIGHLQHSHLWITFGSRWGKYLLGPAHHQLHHSVAPEHHNRNFGNILTLFDRLFGTFTMPEQTRQPIKFGIDAAHFDPQSIKGMTVQPFIEALRALPFVDRPCNEALHARKRTAPRAGLLRRDQPGGVHARDHQGGVAPRPRIARVP